jgi:hypothetical protein
MIVNKDNIVYDSRNNCNAIIETATNDLIKGCKNTIIPNDITGIGPHAFSDCVDLSSIRIPESVRNISPWAFSRCSNLNSIVFPKSMTNIGIGAISGCNSLKSITLPKSIKLKNIEIPNQTIIYRHQN